jgi:hypothetical protein
VARALRGGTFAATPPFGGAAVADITMPVASGRNTQKALETTPYSGIASLHVYSIPQKNIFVEEGLWMMAFRFHSKLTRIA